MRVLQVHKFFWQRDGASNYFFTLSDLLRTNGQTVVPFSMQHPQNLPSEFAPFFVSQLDLQAPGTLSLIQKIQALGRIFYSREAKQNIDRLLAAHPLDIAHLHNIYNHLSPSILAPLKKRGIPIVMTLHDYNLFSPNYNLFHHGAVHAEDAQGWHWSCVKNKCVKDSTVQSIIAVAALNFHQRLGRYYQRHIDMLIAPSVFMYDFCVRAGWPKNKIIHIPHPVTVLPEVAAVDRGYVVYAGRLSEEKGIRTLVAAAQKMSHIEFHIFGDGPLRSELENQAKTHHNIIFKGHCSLAEVQAAMSEARVVVVPSVCHEVAPLSVLEAKAAGKVVIGTTLGGIPEMLPTELLVAPGDVVGLQNKIEEVIAWSEATRQTYGKKFRAKVLQDHATQTHVKNILALYHSLRK